MKEYVAQLDGAYRITESRDTRESVVYAWREGLSPESIRENFPVLTLEEVYGALTFYLANRSCSAQSPSVRTLFTMSWDKQ